MKLGTCDCCQKPNVELHERWGFGIETYACAECCGLLDLEDEADAAE